MGKKTREEASEYFINYVTNIGGQVIGQYVNSATPVHCKCPYGHDCYPWPRNVVNKGQGICNTCAMNNSGKTRGENAWARFQQNIRSLNGIVIEPEWLGDGEKHRCICSQGHECLTIPSHIVRGQGMCNTCAKINTTITKKNKTWKEFRLCISELGGSIIEETYKGFGIGHRCICPKGHECSPSPATVLSLEHGMCMTCGLEQSLITRRLTIGESLWQQFQSKVNSIGGVVIEPDYLGLVKPHHCICVNGHDCYPRPHDFLNGKQTGICGICGHARTKQHKLDTMGAIAHVKFVRIVTTLGGKDVGGQWEGAAVKRHIICPEGHDSYVLPGNVNAREGGICMKCTGKNPTAFYVVCNHNYSIIKLGITNGNANQRLGKHKRDGYSRKLFLVLDLPSGMARNVETQILYDLRDNQYFPVQGYEYFGSAAKSLILSLSGKYLSDKSIAIWKSYTDIEN
jgi:hypothetical protein